MSHTLLYVHGFASSGQSSKVEELKDILRCNVIAPDLQHRPMSDVAMLAQIISTEHVATIVGSSLGGFYALILALQFKVNLILINPSLSPQITLQDQVGLVKNFKGGEFSWQMKQINELAVMVNSINPQVIKQSEIDLSHVLVLLAEQDQRLDYRDAVNLLHGAKIIIDQQQNHRFSNIGIYADDIRNVSQVRN